MFALTFNSAADINTKCELRSTLSLPTERKYEILALDKVALLTSNKSVYEILQKERNGEVDKRLGSILKSYLSDFDGEP